MIKPNIANNTHTAWHRSLFLCASLLFATHAVAQQSPQTVGDEIGQFHSIVRPIRIAELPPRVTGNIAEVHVHEGQYVQKGEPLISLDDRIAKARLHVATVEAGLNGGLKRAQVQLQVAERKLERIRRAVSGRAAAEFELEAAESERDQAQALVEQQQDALAAAEAQRQLAEMELQQFVIAAPFDGVVTRIHQQSGAVDPSRELVTVANLDELEVELHIPAARFGSLRRGQKVPLTAAAPVSRTLTGTVVAVSPIIDAASDTFRCRVQLQNRSVQLPAGFTVVLQSGSNSGTDVTTEGRISSARSAAGRSLPAN